MVDTISNAKSIRLAGSATTRYGAPPAASDPAVSDRPVTPVAAPANAGQDDHGGGAEGESRREFPQDGDSAGLRLEIANDGNGNEVVYRFVDAQTGNVVREWDAGEFGKLREYMRAKKIHLLDRKV